MINWKALDNVPMLLYILALKTLLLCMAFAGAKIYQNAGAPRQQEGGLSREEKLLYTGRRVTDLRNKPPTPHRSQMSDCQQQEDIPVL
ncbi:hypothetical protein PFLUV_G00272820 [Perca fluviatilis]|uniref:Uncharacterized protein n=1 Tax=Perca fluviatilis TaxID=8168 RepID=A0A6A5DM46_PERFL|nr:hypothetical protein PFLUV_G00272820 [Perca fluviatilis]